MALVYEKGQPALISDYFIGSTGAAIGLIGDLIDAAGEKVAVIGNVWHPTQKTGTINIRKIGFRAGGTTLNAASEIRVSLQNVSQTVGPPYQPDGVQDQFYDFKTATTAITPSSWNSTGNLSADRVVNLASDSATDANPRRLAVVFEFQVFTAADSLNIVNLVPPQMLSGMGGVVVNVGSWAQNANRYGLIAFECDDGSFAFLSGAVPIATNGTVAVSSTGAIRRAGLRFRVPTVRTLDRVALTFTTPNNCDGRLVLYDGDGTTELRSIDLDNDDCRSTTNALYIDLPFEPVTLAAGTWYRLAFVGGTATAAAVQYVDVAAAALMDGLVLGQDAHWTQHDGTSWAETTIRRPTFGLGFGAFDDGISAGGGLLVNPGMTGGIRG